MLLVRIDSRKKMQAFSVQMRSAEDEKKRTGYFLFDRDSPYIKHCDEDAAVVNIPDFKLTKSISLQWMPYKGKYPEETVLR